MYLLDNDISSLFLRGHEKVTARVLATPPQELWLSSIAADEMLKGVMAAIQREHGKKEPNLERAYESLAEAVRHIARFNLLPHTNEAEALWKSWPAKIRRIGAADTRIAALAICRDLTVVTRNIRHFEQIPKCRYVDWSI